MGYKYLAYLTKPLQIINILRCRVKSYLLSRKIDVGSGKIIVTNHNIDFKIIKGTDAKLLLHGNLYIEAHLYGTGPVRLILHEGSRLEINGDFTIGQGVRIFLSKKANLYIGGRRNESGSGITADTLIMVRKNMRIGVDFICAWGNYLTDCDWHTIESSNPHADVIIGEHVWIANNCNILKGSIIGNNCIIASNSKLSNTTIQPDSLVAGQPGVVVKNGINWKRDI